MTNISITEWLVDKLDAVRDEARLVVSDPLQLLPANGGSALNTFRENNGFVSIIAATNLVLRDGLRQFQEDDNAQKLLLVDRTPRSRRGQTGGKKAPAAFYPDLLDGLSEDARVELDLRQFLVEVTGDTNWPTTANDPRYAKLISDYLPGVLRAHQNLRTSDPSRFTDHDFDCIVGYAALGVAEAAFKKLSPEQYWQIGLLGHSALDRLDALTPDVAKPIREELRKAPPPFCWFEDHDADTVVQAFYLAVVLSQHSDQWSALLPIIDPAFADFALVQSDILQDTAPSLVDQGPERAAQDIALAEDSLTVETLQQVLLDQLGIQNVEPAAKLAVAERYSTLFSSLALLVCLDDLLSDSPAEKPLKQVMDAVVADEAGEGVGFLQRRECPAWQGLVEGIGLALDVKQLRRKLADGVKKLKVQKTQALDFDQFRSLWVDDDVGRLEYSLSSLERLADTGDLLPRPEAELPPFFGEVRERLRTRVAKLSQDVHGLLDQMNERFQDLVALRYPEWVAEDGPVYLTSHFLRRCLKPNWDPQTEDAVVLIFDGMRYDIWSELLRPMLEERLMLIADLPASSIIPSETNLTRKALSAGTFPDEFDTHAAENALLEAALGREFGYSGKVKQIDPEGAGTAEVVRYEAERLQVRIFELCDRELHKVSAQERPDGRWAPSRPLEYIYKQQIKNIIDNEVMAAVRGLSPGTKVFVTADHGFVRVGRDKLWFDPEDLDKDEDCRYLNASLRVAWPDAHFPRGKRDRVIAFEPGQLRLPVEQHDRSVVFPRAGHAFRRVGWSFKPDAWSHGGISLQELMIPMVVMQVKSQEDSLVALGDIEGPEVAVEGDELEFHLEVQCTPPIGDDQDDLRLEIDASYRGEYEGADARLLPRKTAYASGTGTEVVYAFTPEAHEPTDDERRQGTMVRTLTITVSYQAGGRTLRKSQTRPFKITLNPDQVVRRVSPKLGSILGLTPRRTGR